MKQEITIQKILSILRNHLKLIVLLTAVVTLIMFFYSKFFITPIYSTSAIILVQNYDNSETPTESATQETTTEAQRVWSSDLSTSATLADFCTVLFLNSPVMSEVLEGCSLSISSENETNFLRLTVSCEDPQKAATVANQVAETAYPVFLEVYKAGNVIKIRDAAVPSAPSSPNITQNTMYGFIAGLAISILISLFLDVIDTTIKPDDDLFKQYGIPVLAEVMDFEHKE